MSQFLDFVRPRVTGDLVSLDIEQQAAADFGLSLAETQIMLLEDGLLPARYQRNRTMLSTEEQLRLCRSTVAVIGCGGLGGYIIEELARLGIGAITAVDPDVFDEHNLNRQLLSAPRLLGHAKVDAAAQRVEDINPAVRVRAEKRAYGEGPGSNLLQGVEVVVDALDNLAVRRKLGAECRLLGIPWVHGAIAGWFGQVGTFFPEDTLPEQLQETGPEKGVETELGNPSFTPAVVASLQVAEVCKILIERGTPLRGRMLNIDLKDMEFVEIPL